MHPPPLCRERLNRIQRVLACHPEGLSIRNFDRSFKVSPWEIEAAATLGWLEIETRKPHTGRPSRVALNVSRTDGAKLPPWRSELPKRITIRQWLFALHSTGVERFEGATFGFRCTPLVYVYQTVFPKATRRNGARASASRLKRHPHVWAARAWFYASQGNEIPKGEPAPDTAVGIVQRLRELNNWRVQRYT